MDIPQQLQAGFFIAAALIVLLASLPGLRHRFVSYGPRATITGGRNGNELQQGSMEAGSLSQFLDALATLQISHGCFVHFYIASILSSIFWLAQLLTKGSAFLLISQHAGPRSPAKSMSVDQVFLTLAMMTIQGTRRLLESLAFAKSSKSKMWFAHWLLGIGFYLAINIALWVEGSATLLHSEPFFAHITMSAPSLKTIVGIPIFILASGIQHDCHAYLASLPKYTLPMHPIFQVLVCPHYFTECLIYLSLAIVGAPRGALLNKTIFTALLFVTTNLAVTASMTKEMYERRFGKETIRERWKMVPWLF